MNAGSDGTRPKMNFAILKIMLRALQCYSCWLGAQIELYIEEIKLLLVDSEAEVNETLKSVNVV